MPSTRPKGFSWLVRSLKSLHQAHPANDARVDGILGLEDDHTERMSIALVGEQ
jgi:hypothetical protein